jgi:hypothetical protein
MKEQVMGNEVKCTPLFSGFKGLRTLAVFQFLNPKHSRQASLDGGSARRKVVTYTQDNTKTQNKFVQTSMSRVGFELTTLVFERAKTIHALDRAATVIGQVK